ncbi:hypothetical protein [Micromonospora musae]|uniref:Uncharacterized protein n=1 Tax=Micromonospora musae TaxID=1894970 RepID=A0A3A9XQ21_9ACTN|nr:hypothetical protein [Micromonospora musae]RKN27249.1 hypothetical protein D7044_27990 [Micromonospora musae]
MVDGFVYANNEPDHPLAGAQVGARVRLPSFDPPWIVLHHRLDVVRPARWPGRLFRVRSVPAETEEERVALEAAGWNLRTDASYRRVFAVDVLAELSPALLFGPNGAAVVEVLDRADRLTEVVARDLAAARHPGAAGAYRRAWERWLSGQPNGAAYRDGDHSGVLAVPGASPAGSPIGIGFAAISICVTASARQRAGSAAFIFDEDDDEELLVEPWSTAGAALIEAAMALGAPELVDEADRAALTAAWRAIRRS